MELIPIQRRRLGSAQRTPSEPNAGLRHPESQPEPALGHQRDSPEARCQAHSTGRLFPVRSSPLTPGPGSQEDPKSKSRVTQVFTLPDSERASDAKEVGGWGGRKQKEKSGLPGPPYLGSLNGFQIKAKGLPWTCSTRGCFPGNVLAAPTEGRQVRGTEPGSLPSSPSWWLG